MASLASMLIQETKQAIYARGLAVARGLGLATTSWVAGDPTRSLYWFLAEVLSTLEYVVAGYVASGFLDYASGDWLTLLAKQGFNVTRTSATYAYASVTLTNGGGGLYVIRAGDVVVSYTDGAGKRWTYTNTSGGTLASGPGTTLTLDFSADVAGSAPSAPALGINAMVTGLVGVTCSNALASVGIDEEPDADLRTRCRAKLGMLSPNGPADAYNFVVRTPELTGVTDITRSRTAADSSTGAVTVYVGSASGGVAAASVTAAQAAVVKWATPICTTPTVVNCTSLAVPVAYTVWMYQTAGVTAAAVQAQIAADLAAMFSARPIGGDVIAPATTGALYVSLIAATIRASFPSAIFRVSVTAPAADVALATNQIAALDAVTPTVVFEVSP